MVLFSSRLLQETAQLQGKTFLCSVSHQIFIYTRPAPAALLDAKIYLYYLSYSFPITYCYIYIYNNM